MSKRAVILKRTFDVFCSFGALLFCWPLILIGWVLAFFGSGESGFFCQERIGMHGSRFNIIKLKTMKTVKAGTSVTCANDSRITKIGRLLRKTKIDELPQLINVLKGDMSFVGPRPDVQGFADQLKGEDTIILSVRPGITGPATLLFRDEEDLLAGVEDPQRYNLEVIWPKKVAINREYIENYSFLRDVLYIIKTIQPS